MTAEDSAPEDADLVAHVRAIRNTIRQLQGLPPLDEETE